MEDMVGFPKDQVGKDLALEYSNADQGGERVWLLYKLRPGGIPMRPWFHIGRIGDEEKKAARHYLEALNFSHLTDEVLSELDHIDKSSKEEKA